jgi:iron complex transport system substrate-binding protein
MINRTRRQKHAILALAFLTATGFASAQEQPQRIVSIVPALTEALFAMGAGDQVVGVGSFDTHPPDVAARPRVGGLLDPDMEQIFLLRPDIVVLYGSQRDQTEQLARAGIQVIPYTHGGIDDTLSVISHLGMQIKRPNAAKRLVQSMQAKLKTVRTQVARRERPSVLLVFGREPGALRNIYASGGTGFLHDMLEAAGGRNVFAHIARESLQVTSEAILTAAPDVVIELTYDDRMTPKTRAAEVAVWNRLPAVPAVRSQQVHLFLGNHFVQPGPRLAEATTAIARALHPEALLP